MANQYRAVEDFIYPADADSLKKAKAGRMGEVVWTEVKKGAKVTPFSDEILKSWKANGTVEPTGKGGDEE